VKGPKATQTITTEAGFRVYSWTYSKLQDTKDAESDQKKVTEAARGRLPAPDVQISSFQSWEEVGRWYWNLQKDRVEPTAAIRAKAAELTKGMTNDDAKLHALYGFVSMQYRYIGIAFGIGRYQPHTAEDVLTNNYGDCKDKHTLLASLLQASGITLYPALISSSWKLDPDVPSPAQFDHVIGYLPQGKDAVWLDTTPEVAPFGYLLAQLRDKQALVISGDKPMETLNDISYELAEANASLPKALEYAQLAVDKQEKESDDVELSNLLPEDLRCTQKIGNAWDTLGWIHFRLGHLDQAESYLHAAWLLMQVSVVADHLGQVYEQEKKTEKALHMYHLALATPQAYGGSWDETRHRLEHLTGTKAPTEMNLLRTDPTGAELSQLRSVKLKRLVPGSATAEFFLLFSPGPKVEDVEFISGSEKLKSAGQVLSEAKFQVAFPEGSSARLVRRAILMCSNVTGCEAVLLTPDSVNIRQMIGFCSLCDLAFLTII
jgi:hypothetical protein